MCIAICPLFFFEGGEGIKILLGILPVSCRYARWELHLLLDRMESLDTTDVDVWIVQWTPQLSSSR